VEAAHRQVADMVADMVADREAVDMVAGEVVDKEVVVPVLHNSLDFDSYFPAQNHRGVNYLIVYKYFRMVMNKNIWGILMKSLNQYIKSTVNRGSKLLFSTPGIIRRWRYSKKRKLDLKAFLRRYLSR
jgi:hypothetical protein